MTQEQKNVIIPGVAVNTSTSTFPAPVGIGSSDPQSVLHIFSAAPVVKVEDSAAGTTASPTIQFLASNGTMGFVGYTGSGMQLLNAMNTSLVISTNNLERVRITQSGSMGIGMTAPTTALGVSGSGSFSGIVSASGISAVGATFAGNISVGGIMVGRGGGNQTTNVAIGLNALQLQTGSNNTAVGSNALANAVDSSGNVAVGMDSLRYLIVGSNNTAVGQYSQGIVSTMTSAQQPSNNTSVGYASLTLNQTGHYNVALGSQALQTCTAGNQNTAVGYQTLLNNWASNNIAVGAQAMRSNKKGTDNVALGVMALSGNTAGNWNVAIGSDALLNNIANGNLAIGYGALYTNVASNQNIAIGHLTLYSNQTGAFNVAMGFRALQGNTSGSSNTAVGDQALTKNKSGNSNTAIGSQALYENLTGYSNVGVGSDALVSNTTGYNNTAIGGRALNKNLIGYQNTAVGTESMYSCEAGVNNIALGYQALYGTTGGAQNIAIGVQALQVNTASYNLAIGYQALQGNDKGTSNVAVGHYALLGNTNGGSNTAIGHAAMQYNKSGSSNSALGYQALFLNDTGINNTAIGAGTLYGNISGSYNVAIGNAALNSNTASNNTAIGEGSLYKNTTGGSNTSVGKDSLTSNISGGNNSALGVNALRGNSGGSENTAIGINALPQNISGGNNSALGAYAMYANLVGSQNTAVGRYALGSQLNSSNNTGIGYEALRGNTAGSNSTAVGYQAGYSSASGTIVRGVFIGAGTIGANPASSTDEIVIGAGATGTGNNTAVIGKSTQTAATIYGMVTASLGVTAPQMFTASLTASTLHVTGVSTLAGVTAQWLSVSGGITAQKILATKLSVGATASIDFQDTLTVTPPFSEAPQGIGFYSAENLLRNGNFPNTTVGGVAEGWTVYGYAGASDTGTNGTASWAAAAGGSGPRGVAAVVLECNNGGGAYQTVNLTPGAVYTVSARIRVSTLNSGDSSHARFAIGHAGSSTGISDAIVNVNLHDSGNSLYKWCYCSQTFTVPASALLTTPILVGVRSMGNTHSIQVTDIALYKGGIPKVFSPITVQEDTQQVLIGGNIGVGGVTAPAARLHVKSAREGLRLETTAGVGNNYLTFYAGSTIKSYIGQHTTNDDLYIINVANNPLYLGTNNSIDLAILADGKVGIGITTPLGAAESTSKLHVVGAAVAAGAANSGILTVGNTGNTRQINFGVNDTNSTVYIEGWVPGAGLSDLVLQPTSGGRVGIGVANPQVALDVVGGIKASTTLNVAGVATLAGVTAQSLWVSGGITAATVSATTFTGALVGNATTATTATTLKDAAFNRITNPAGGYFENNTNDPKTGAIKVTLPVTWTNTMMRIKISVYDYSPRKSFDVVCGGYNYAGSSQWINTFAYIEGDGGTTTNINYNIRFGHDGTKCAIWIGEANSEWTAFGPKVAITEVMAGHSVVDLSTGWVISIDTVTPSTLSSFITPGLRSCAIAPTQAFHLANKAYVDGISEVPTANNASYTKLPNGTLMQWGRTPSVNANASATVTFPTAFSATCLPVVTTTTVGIQTTGILTSCHAAATSTAVTVHNNYSAAAVIEWIAMGY